MESRSQLMMSWNYSFHSIVPIVGSTCQPLGSTVSSALCRCHFNRQKIEFHLEKLTQKSQKWIENQFFLDECGLIFYWPRENFIGIDWWEDWDNTYPPKCTCWMQSLVGKNYRDIPVALRAIRYVKVTISNYSYYPSCWWFCTSSPLDLHSIKPWRTRLRAISCTTLDCKMKLISLKFDFKKN